MPGMGVYSEATSKLLPNATRFEKGNLRLEAIFYNDNLSYEQKLAQYKKLLPLYPQCTAGLNSIINDLQKQLAQK